MPFNALELFLLYALTVELNCRGSGGRVDWMASHPLALIAHQKYNRWKIYQTEMRASQTLKKPISLIF